MHPIAILIGIVALVTHCFTTTGIQFRNFLVKQISTIICMAFLFTSSGTLFTLPQDQLLAQIPSDLR
jgi:hypothetical protein